MKEMSGLDWEDIKTVMEVARSGTVRRAGVRLGVHHSTISRRIERLEERAGVHLFERRPEGYILTEAGEDLVRVANDFAARLGTVERHIAGRDTDLTGQITATMPEPIAIHCIAPRLPDFTSRYPGLALKIIVTTDFLDLARREADVAIRLDNNPPQSLVGKRLFPYHTSVYASPDYLETRNLDTDPQSGCWLGWCDDEDLYPDWTQDTEFARVPAWGCFPDMAIQHAAAKAGLGLTMLPCYCADRDPGLVRVTHKPPKSSRDIWILTHSDLRRTARVKAFMDFAENALRAEQAKITGEK